DSLKKVLPSLRDSARVDCLNALSGIYFNLNGDTAYCSNEYHISLNFSNIASHYSALAYEEAVKINYIHGIAESLSYKAESKDFSENYIAEEKFSREAINWYRKTVNKKRLAETYWYLGMSLYA